MATPKTASKVAPPPYLGHQPFTWRQPKAKIRGGPRVWPDRWTSACPWVQVPTDLLLDLPLVGVPAGDLALLLAVVAAGWFGDVTDHRRDTWPVVQVSVARLCRATGLSRSAVQRGLARLEEFEVIWRRDRPSARAYNRLDLTPLDRRLEAIWLARHETAGVPADQQELAYDRATPAQVEEVRVVLKRRRGPRRRAGGRDPGEQLPLFLIGEKMV